MKNRRARSVLITGVALATIAGLGFAWASGATAAESRFVTAAATTGDVSESYLATGTVSRENVVEAAFSGSGTVTQVAVSVGDEVAAGDLLARLDTAALKLALLNAQTDLARAKANLYAAEHPSSVSSGVKLPSGLTSGSTNPGGGSLPGGISATDAATLYRAIAAVNVAAATWSNPQTPTTCDLIHAALRRANEQEPTPEPPGEPTTEPTSQPTTEPSGEPTAEPTSGPSTGPSPEPTVTPEPTATPTAEPGPSPTSEPTSEPSGEAEPLALVVDDITLEDITACGKARTDLLMANAVLADYYQQLLTTGTFVADGAPAAPGGRPDSATPPRGSSGRTTTSATPKVSARAVASAEAEVLRAQQAVDAAERALSDAELTAPISGTVGAVSLAVGDSAAAGSVTIVGEGTAVVSLEVPLASRTLLSQGMAAVVTPAGSLDSLSGSVGRISLLETEGTAGDSPTYTTTVVVEDLGMLLKTGAPAGVEIVTRTGSGVVTVPVSAVTPTGPGAGTVQVVEHPDADTAQTVTVSTGAVGGGRIEITDGLSSGQLVVLSDRTAPLPSGNLTQMRRTMGGR